MFLSFSPYQFLKSYLPYLLIFLVPGYVISQITWQVQSDYFGERNAVAQPRTLRGMALSHDGLSVYTGLIQSPNVGTTSLRKVSSEILTVPGTDYVIFGNGMPGGTGGFGPVGTNPVYDGGNSEKFHAWRDVPNSPEGIATDDRGFVYVALTSGTSNANRIEIYNSDLSAQVGTFMTSGNPRGVKIHKIENTYYAYTASDLGLQRYDVTNVAGPILDGTYTPGIFGLTNLDIDLDGTVYVTGNNQVRRISPTGNLTHTSATINNAQGIAVFYNKLYVIKTGSPSQSISILNKSDLTSAGDDLTVPDFGISRSLTVSQFRAIDVNAQGNLYISEENYNGTQNSICSGGGCLTSYTPPATTFNPSPVAITGRIYFDRVVQSSPVEPDYANIQVTVTDANCSSPLGSALITYNGWFSQYSMNGINYVNAPASPFNLTDLNPGSHTIYIKDGVGNISSKTFSVGSVKVINLTRNTTHSSIQEGINSANSGDTIEVCSGVFNEQINVSKSLFIRGANYQVNPISGNRVGESTITFNGDYVVDVFANDVVFEGFTILNESIYGNAVRISVGKAGGSVSNVLIKNNIAQGNSGLEGMGVLSLTDFDVSNYIVNNIDFVNNKVNVSPSGSGITMWSLNNSQLLGNNSIIGNEILINSNAGNSFGIWLNSDSSNHTSFQGIEIIGNEIKGGFNKGIFIGGWATSIISGNSFLNNRHDLWLQTSASNVLNNNIIGSNNIFTGSISAIRIGSLKNLDISGSAIGSTFHGQIFNSTTPLAGLFSIENKIIHKIDSDTLGFVRLKTGQVFVTQNSFVSPYTAPSIQRAINAAMEGDTVNVDACTYEETIDLNKTNLSLIANGTAIIKGVPNSDALTIRFSADGVLLEGFTIENTNVGNLNNRAIAPQNSIGAKIKNNLVKNSNQGIQLNFNGSPVDLEISGNTFDSTVNLGIIGLENTLNLEITNNNFYNNQEFIRFSSGVTLKNNRLFKNRFLGSGKIVNNTSIVIDAKENYWGSSDPNIDLKLQGEFITCPFYGDFALTQLVSIEDDNPLNGIEKKDTVCHGTPININFPETNGNIAYEWTNSNTQIGLNASGLGNISFTAINSTSQAQVAWIKVLPKKGSCVGTLDSIQILVACSELNGKVEWHRTGTGINGVRINRIGDRVDQAITNSEANYSLESSRGTLFKIYPDTLGSGMYTSSNLSAYGINDDDLQIINRYINGETSLLTGYNLIAADINENRSVTAADAIILQYALEGVPTAIDFLKTKPWVFVDADQILNPVNPWNYLDTITISNQNGSIDNLNFIGIRKGDVTGTGGGLNYNLASNPEANRTALQNGIAPTLELGLKSSSLVANYGDEVVLNLIIESLTGADSINLYTLDAGIVWDPSKFSFQDTLRKNLKYGNARISVSPTSGELLFNWFETTTFNGGFFKQGDTLISVKLNVISSPGSTTITLGKTNNTNPPGNTSYLIGPAHSDVFTEKVPHFTPLSISLNPSFTISTVIGNNSVLCTTDAHFAFTPIVPSPPITPNYYKIVFNDISILAGFYSTYEGIWDGISPIAIPFPVDFVRGNYNFQIQVGKDNFLSNPMSVSFTVEQNPTLEIAGISDVCLNTHQIGVLSVYPPSTLTENYSYQWNLSNSYLQFNGSSLNFTMPSAGIYDISARVTTPGCGNKEIKKTFEVKPIPKITFPIDSSTITLCNDKEIIVAFQSNVPGSNFNWSSSLLTGQISTQIPVSGAGVIKFTSSNIDSASISVTPSAKECIGSPVNFKLILAAGTSEDLNFEIIPDTLCTNSSPISLSVGSFNGLGVEAATFDPKFAGPGKHFISYSSNTGNCTTTKVDSIVVLPQPIASISAIDTLVCYNANGSFLITGTPGARAWYSVNGTVNSAIIPATVQVNNITSLINIKLDSVFLEESLSCSRYYNDSIQIFPRPSLNSMPQLVLANPINCIEDNVGINFSDGVPHSRLYYHLTGETSQAINLNSSGLASLSLSGLTQSTTFTVDSISFRNNPMCTEQPTNNDINIPIFKIPTIGKVNTITICSDTDLSINLNNYITNPNEVSTQFTWVASPVDGINGISFSGSGHLINQKLISTAGEVKTVEYIITAKNQSGLSCQTNFTLRVRVLPVPNPKVIVENQSICPGEILNIKVSDFYGLEGIVNYSWSRNSVSGVIGLENGTGDIIGTITQNSNLTANLTYTIIATPNNACQASQIIQNITLLPNDICFNCSVLNTSIILGNIPINIDTTIAAATSITSASIIDETNTVNFRAGSSITLLPGFEVSSGSTFTAKIIECTPFVNPVAPEGSLNLSLLSNLSESSRFEIFPNPAYDFLNLEIFNPEESRVIISILDFKGSFVKSVLSNEILPQGTFKLQTDLNQLKSGIYFVTYTTKSYRSTKKLIISR